MCIRGIIKVQTEKQKDPGDADNIPRRDQQL